jgi:hypothetical protein
MARNWLTFVRNLFRWLPCVGGRRDQDAVEVELPYARIFVCRNRTEPARSELTVVIPRVEFRARRQDRSGGVTATELILNSITVVDAPRHALSGQGQNHSQSREPSKTGPPVQSGPPPNTSPTPQVPETRPPRLP